MIDKLRIAKLLWGIFLVIFIITWLSLNPSAFMVGAFLVPLAILPLSIIIFNRSPKPIRILHHVVVIPALLACLFYIFASGEFGPFWVLFGIGVGYIVFLIILAIVYALYRWFNARGA